ncbi:TD and POZ domain-containing protein 5 [Caerostris extrusa]|uniref:TD and POZ domain-containing protein 5 n=1 Tax=Caerostris extrusa TaxID=172846 RepID=A0AAV4PPZ9_CAEEX|nr:TD and POZ domain-containing protein 5 [Caerostris extrusa]
MWLFENRGNMERSDTPLFTYLWKIKNFNFCSARVTLTSPEFVVEGLNNTRWALYLRPRDTSEEEAEVTYYLHRMDNAGPETLTLDYRLSLVDVKGSSLKHAMFRSYSFKRNGRDGCAAHVLRDEVVVEKKSSYLADDTLMIRCEMWRVGQEETRVGHCVAHSHIGVERVSVTWAIENFSELQVLQRTPVPIRWASRENPLFSMNLYKSDDRLFLHVLFKGGRIFEMCIFKLYLLDTSLKRREWNQYEISLTPKVQQEYNMCLCSLKKILDKKSTFLDKDTLNMECELSIAGGVTSKEIESTVYGPCPQGMTCVIM